MPYWHIDAGMAAMIMLLGAVDAGLGALFFGVPAERWPALRAASTCRSGLRPVGVVSLGYSGAGPPLAVARRGRRPLESRSSLTARSVAVLSRSACAGLGGQLRAPSRATIRSRSSIEANSTVILPLRRPSSTRTRVSKASDSRSARSVDARCGDARRGRATGRLLVAVPAGVQGDEFLGRAHRQSLRRRCGRRARPAGRRPRGRATPGRGRPTARRRRPGAAPGSGRFSSRIVLLTCGRLRPMRCASSSWVVPNSSSSCW